jgi:hypothetical protein
MGEKPTAAFVLSLLAAIFIIIGGLFYVVVSSWIGGALDFIGMGGWGYSFVIIGVLGMVWGILTLIGAVMINSGEPSKVKTGAILVLIFSIISWFGAAGGFFIGFLLGLIGAILGLTWKPERSERAPPPPP